MTRSFAGEREWEKVIYQAGMALVMSKIAGAGQREMARAQKFHQEASVLPQNYFMFFYCTQYLYGSVRLQTYSVI
ncbi:hypothetical protein [Clostridium sp. M62/1]|uniref:hypothetical protein n=1 Tax=Clostridium sp. M62/1 TaxID=411486 RepID=UPI001F61652D|nr:hypothetical protein [Clostridium sp. M62/1]